VDTFLLAVTALATVIGTAGGLILQHKGNKHFEEQNRIMIEQGRGKGKATQAQVYKPPRWPLVAMAVMVMLCWGAAIYGYFARQSNVSPQLNWESYQLKEIAHLRFSNETVHQDGYQYIDTHVRQREPSGAGGKQVRYRSC